MFFGADLRRKLDTFETDLPRKLNVLRGFFCYMKVTYILLYLVITLLFSLSGTVSCFA